MELDKKRPGSPIDVSTPSKRGNEEVAAEEVIGKETPVESDRCFT